MDRSLDYLDALAGLKSASINVVDTFDQLVGDAIGVADGGEVLARLDLVQRDNRVFGDLFAVTLLVEDSIFIQKGQAFADGLCLVPGQCAFAEEQLTEQGPADGDVARLKTLHAGLVLVLRRTNQLLGLAGGNAFQSRIRPRCSAASIRVAVGCALICHGGRSDSIGR